MEVRDDNGSFTSQGVQRLEHKKILLPFAAPAQAVYLAAYRPQRAFVDYGAAYPVRTPFTFGVLLEPTAPPDTVFTATLSDILPEGASRWCLLDWKSLRASQPFPAPPPQKMQMPEQPEPPILPDIPAPKFKQQPPAPEFQIQTPAFTFFQRLFPALREKALRRADEQAQNRLRREQAEWEENVAAITADNDAIWQHYERKKAEQLTSEDYIAYTQATSHWQGQATLLEQECSAAVAAWQQAKLKFEAAAETQRAQLAELRDRYLAGNAEAIQVIVRRTLEKSRYPFAYPRSIEVHYNPENRIVLITLQLPDFQRISILRDGKKIGQREKTQLQEDAVYSIALRTLYEVVASDEINAIDSVALNGWVDFIDGATGQPRQACILSVHATKSQIATLNIAQVEECFRALKGIAAKRVSVYTPVQPILTLNKEDDRLIEGRPVITGYQQTRT